MRLVELQNTRIRVSVPTELSIRPIWDVDLEYGILLTNLMGGQGHKIQAAQDYGMIIEVISQYKPMDEQNGDREYAEGD